MATFTTTVPFAGSITASVEADSEAEAIDKLISAPWRLGDIELSEENPDITNLDLGEELEALKSVTRGNVCYAPENEAWAEREED